MNGRLDELITAIRPADARSARAARERHDELAKPPGSLGGLETLGVRLAAIAGACPPPVPARPALIVAAGDHGVHAEGVTPWPQDVTAAVTSAICSGRAASSVLAAQVGASVDVLDVGVAADLAPHDRLTDAKVRRGTRNLLHEDAMTIDEATAAILAGARLAQARIDDGTDVLVTGDMGIANTTASACLVAAFTGAGADIVTGRGTGIDDGMLAHKVDIVARAVERHSSRVLDAPMSGGEQHTPSLATLAALGGLEHAALVGVILAGAAARVPVVLDGVIANAAAVAAADLAPDTTGFLVAGHRSTEPGAAIALKHLGLDPLLDLDLRLGEGTGALLAVPLVRAAAAVLNDMATLAELGA